MAEQTPEPSDRSRPTRCPSRARDSDPTADDRAGARLDAAELEVVRRAARYADTWVALRRRTLRVPGVQLAVAVAGEVLVETAHGSARLPGTDGPDDDGEPLRTDHLFRIASHSKTFTATAVMQLVEQGRLRLDDTGRAARPRPGRRRRRRPHGRPSCSRTAAASSATPTTATSGRSTGRSPTAPPWWRPRTTPRTCCRRTSSSSTPTSATGWWAW